MAAIAVASLLVAAAWPLSELISNPYWRKMLRFGYLGMIASFIIILAGAK